MKQPIRMERQSGISLVEIMVSLVAGLILTAGVIQIYAANAQAYRVADANARIQENARFATQFLGMHVRMAGYRDDASQNFSDAFPAPSPPPYAGYSFAAGEVIRGGANEVVIRYQGDGVMRDCEDFSTVAAGTPVTVRLYLNNGALYCGTDLDAGGDQPLVPDVSQMTILYGVDTDGDGTANCFDQAANLNNAPPTTCGQPSTAPWSQVVSARITLILQSAENNTSVTTGNRLQKTYSTTIAIRNRLP